MEATAVNFEQEVLEASKSRLVLVDFWAPWCAPCRTLGPVLEKLEGEYGGRVKLVKINSDEQAELAAAFGVRSIPYVVAFRDGKPASQFLGALPEGQVRAFIDKLLPPPQLAAAAAALDAGRLDEADRLLDGIRPDIDWDERVATLRQAVAFARAGGSETDLAARVAANPADHASRLALAGLQAAKHRYGEALEQLLEIVRRDKDWNGGEARRQMLAIFNLAAGEAGLVSEYRRKLAAALY
jgi:putative thioredoxin